MTREISRFIPGKGWIRPSPTLRTIDAQDVLALARRLAYRLTGQGARVAPDALAAITTYRHGLQGQRWAASILAKLGDNYETEALEAAIVVALTKV